MLSRREFLTSTGSGLVTLALIPLVHACGSDSTPPTSTSVGSTTPTPTGTGCDGAGETSTVSEGHTHSLCVPVSDLRAPPAAGATYRTSVDGGHDHLVSLSQAQLTTVANGGSVKVTASTVAGHTHDFSLQASVVQTTKMPPPSPPPYSMY